MLQGLVSRRRKRSSKVKGWTDNKQIKRLLQLHKGKVILNKQTEMELKIGKRVEVKKKNNKKKMI